MSPFKYGQCVKNPEFWKLVQVFLAIVAAFLPFLSDAYPPLLTLIEHDTINKLNAGIIAVVGALTPATTDKIGL
jgi:hypothetical protein